MPKTLSSRLFFALFAAVLASIIARNVYRRYFNNALIRAIEKEDVGTARALLDRGADPNGRRPRENDSSFSDRALTVAMERTGSVVDINKRDDIACLLIEHGADIRDNPKNYSSCLKDACEKGSVKVVRCLLEHGADTNFVGIGSQTALGHAIEYRDYSISAGSSSSQSPQKRARRLAASREMVALLRQHHARFTPSQAVQIEDVALLRESLAKGEDANAQDQNGRSALGAATEQGSLPMMRLLLAHGADPNKAVAYYGPALNMAVGYNRHRASLEAVKLLLAYGANVNAVGKDYDPPLVVAINNQHADIARLLLAHKADPNLERLAGDILTNPLSAAARSLPELVPELLARGANINSGKGLPLREAIRGRHPDLVRYLLAHGAKITLTGGQPASASADEKFTHALPPQTTPPSTLRVAATNDPACFDLLIQAGATLGDDRADILLAAASAGNNGLFDRLIALGANVNIADAQGRTPLTEAILHTPQNVEMLLRHGANPNVAAQGLTPLLTAVQTANASLTRLLLAHGADPNFKPPRSHTPLYFARRHPHADIVRLLEQAGAKAE